MSMLIRGEVECKGPRGNSNLVVLDGALKFTGSLGDHLLEKFISKLQAIGRGMEGAESKETTSI